MGTSSAQPAKLLAFEGASDEALAALHGPALRLAETLAAVRSNADARRMVPEIPMIHQDVLDLHDVGRYLAGWVGDIGRAFLAQDQDGDGVVDDRLLRDIPRIGDGARHTVIRIGNRIFIDTGGGADHVTVTRDPDGRIMVWIDPGVGLQVPGRVVYLTETEAAGLTIRLGSGSDTIEVASDVTFRFTIEGQRGDDLLEGGAGDETIRGGAGRDYIEAYSGDDIIDGGVGNDVVYAGDGDDLVRGGAGFDYLEGGRGHDIVIGGAHDDVISGGEGNDRIDGGEGNDVVYAGQGDDRVTGGRGTNTIYGQPGVDSVEIAAGGTNLVVAVDLSGLPGDSALRIEGSERFQQRVLQDLEMLRSSPTAREMLLTFDERNEGSRSFFADWPLIGGHVHQGDTITIREHVGRRNSFAIPGDEHSPPAIEQSRTIVEMYGGSYTPQPDRIAWQEVPPVVVLFHEMAHHYDLGGDTLMDGEHDEGSYTVPNAERQAVGLPVDHDGNPNTPDRIDPDHLVQYTENGLRREMGLPDRSSYGPP